ncbi:MAG: hypothetical protein ACO2OX_01315 [Candidatus Nanopusillus sp.]
MKRETTLSTNQNQSKTLDKLVSWIDLAAIARAYAYYLSSKGDLVKKVSEYMPQALLPVLKLTYELEEWSSCKNLLTLIDDQKSLKYCTERYSFMGTMMRGIEKSLEKESLTSEQIKTLMEGLTTLQDGQTLDKLYLFYEKTRDVAKLLEISNSFDRDKIFITLISEYLKGAKWLFSEYVTKADNIERAAYKLLWTFYKKPY